MNTTFSANSSLVLSPLWLLVCVAAIFASGCQNSDLPELRPGPSHWFGFHLDEIPFQAQLALTRTEQQQGLMERSELPENGGMLFLFEAPQRLSFWMRNTPLELDIAFFSPDGVLREIHPLHPFDETAVASISDQVQYALEMPRGWFRAHRIRPGARLDLPEVSQAVRSRGFAPARWNLPE